MAAITFHINNLNAAVSDLGDAQTTEATLIRHDLGSGLGFYGGGFGISVPVAGYQDSTFVTSADGTTEAVQCKNTKYTAISGLTVDGVALGTSGTPNYKAPLNIRFTHDSAVSVQNCKLRIFDRSDIGTHATEVTTKVYELRHPNPVNGVNMSLNQGFLTHRGSDNHSWTEYDPTEGGTPPDLTLTSSPGTSGLNTVAGDTIAATDGTYVNHVFKEGAAHQATRHDWYVALSASPTTIGSKTAYGLYFTLEYI